MKFRTELEINKLPFNIYHEDKIFMIGSCFVENIAVKLSRYKFDILSNPFGIIYNPISISNIIQRIIENNIPHQNDFVKHNDLWHHFDFHSDMSGLFLEETILKITKWLEYSKSFLKESKYIFITLGTSIVYKRKEFNNVVANNHKFPSSYFLKSKLNIEEITNSLKNSINKIKTFNEGIKIIFTISPVRHVRDGLIENQKSKAALILAIDQLVDNDTIFYFPSYELLIDDLRDYGFYADDLIHPSKKAIDYMWEKYSQMFFNEVTLNKNKQIEKIVRSLDHIPIHQETKANKEFQKTLEIKIKQFKKNNPEINF